VKIALYSWAFAPSVGGLEKLTEVVAAQLTDAGKEVVVLTGTPDDDGNPPTFPYRVERNPGFAGFYRVVRRCDVVLLYTFSLKLVLAAMLARRPVVWQHIDFDTISPRGICHRLGHPCRGRLGECYRCLRRDHSRRRAGRALASLIAKRILKFAVAVNAVSTEYAAKRMSLPRVEMIGFGIDTDHFVPPAQARSGDGLQIFFCARHIAGKGCDVLISALGRCRKAGLNFTARIGGDGPHREISMRLADRLGLEDCVTFTGYISDDDLLAELQRADVVVVPSLQDEIGQLVAYEAMSCECCVVVSRIGAFPEQLEGAAEFFAPGDVQELSRILAELAADAGRRTRLGAAARRRITERFERKQMTGRYLEVFEKALRRPVS
jgi:glycogen synthase